MMAQTEYALSLRARYEAGATVRDLVRDERKSTPTILRLLREANTTMRRQGPPLRAAHASILDAVRSGEPLKDIGERFGMSIWAVSRLAVAAGERRCRRGDPYERLVAMVGREP